MVTPLAGVWIEISVAASVAISDTVTPLAGVWIEIISKCGVSDCYAVTPLAGVWIEMSRGLRYPFAALSLPLRECGLK